MATNVSGAVDEAARRSVASIPTQRSFRTDEESLAVHLYPGTRAQVVVEILMNDALATTGTVFGLSPRAARSLSE